MNENLSLYRITKVLLPNKGNLIWNILLRITSSSGFFHDQFYVINFDHLILPLKAFTYSTRKRLKFELSSIKSSRRKKLLPETTAQFKILHKNEVPWMSQISLITSDNLVLAADTEFPRFQSRNFQVRVSRFIFQVTGFAFRKDPIDPFVYFKAHKIFGFFSLEN